MDRRPRGTPWPSGPAAAPGWRGGCAWPARTWPVALKLVETLEIIACGGFRGGEVGLRRIFAILGGQR